MRLLTFLYISMAITNSNCSPVISPSSAALRSSDNLRPGPLLRSSPEEGEMTGEQFEFVMAIEMYKKVNKRMYPTWTEVLEVMRQLVYRKVLPRELNLESVPEPELFNDNQAA